MSEPFSLQYNQNIRVTIAGTDQKLRTFLGMDSNHTGDFNEPGLWPLVLYEEVNGKQKVVPPDRVFLEQLENLFDNLAPERGISDPPDPPPAWFVSALPKSVQKRIRGEEIHTRSTREVFSDTQVLAAMQNALMVVENSDCSPDETLSFSDKSIVLASYDYYEFRWNGIAALSCHADGNVEVYVATLLPAPRLLCTASKKRPISKWLIGKTGDPTCPLKKKNLPNRAPVGILIMNEDPTQAATYSLSAHCSFGNTLSPSGVA
ncbi:MAG: hypothetical protein WBD79_23770 [Anaerolineae bacterium]